MAEREYINYKKDISRINNKNKMVTKNQIFDFDDAEELVRTYISENKVKEMSVDSSKLEDKKLTKEDLREEMRLCRKQVSDCILKNNLSVRGFSGSHIDEFIDEMVSEFSGYSILGDAFKDPKVDDIYCLAWNKIYLERDGKNVKYEKTFRNEKHYYNVIERFLRKAGKEINVGDSKIVDFELYGDRGCATSTAVTPNDYTLTMRKHKEDHIKLSDLLRQEVLNQEIADFFGLIIDGESNLIYAGITGSGKTTTIRALLDFYVSRNGKRMLVCEDTQELFPKSDHCMEMVSSRSDDKKADVSLYKLIITALRLKPKYIIVGEVRAEEAQAAVEGMETGHSTIFTMHGKAPINIINRLVTKYLTAMPALGIDVVERIIGSAVDFIAIQDHIPDIGRRVSDITEVNFNDETKRIELRNLMTFDFLYKEDFVWVRRISPDKTRNLMRRGVSKERAVKWTRLEINETDTEEEKNDKKMREKAAIDELNNVYYKEKASRMEIYEKEFQEELKKKEEENLLNKKEYVKEERSVIEQEKLKLKELEDMKTKVENLQKRVN